MFFTNKSLLQVCYEGKLSETTVKNELSRGRRGAGDLIPWTISQEVLQNYSYEI